MNRGPERLEFDPGGRDLADAQRAKMFIKGGQRAPERGARVRRAGTVRWLDVSRLLSIRVGRGSDLLHADCAGLKGGDAGCDKC
ncbi:hypothetical protein [Pseudomonas fluorescens]|nr:hypothetical protein [Pseudomonas fluorescens]